ncbi:DUF3073 domain-containing protein [Aestuariimicrobium ganziense]|uniref:DUF3073 domain-containing protein n=1 Tax=Aestuariimicrobium ganziense TaxID=2773677 RepID=UPI001943D234|nr:DUF3073 domain-containing protein [Aestuariimicrobium ganziense]
MGRGRAKAKQTKVARDLKYRPVNTDFASLERELRTESGGQYTFDEPDYSDLADRYADDEFDEDDDELDEDDEQDVRRTS